jgi:hypothetical protein
VVVLGSSRTGLGLRPAALAGCWGEGPQAPLVYNFSLNGAGTLMELMCLRRLLDDGVRPRYALVEVWPLHLHLKSGPEPPCEIERWRRADARLYAAYWHTREPYRVWRRNLLLPLRSHRTRLLSLCAPWLLAKDERVDDRWVGQDGWGSQVNAHLVAHDAARFAQVTAAWGTFLAPRLQALVIQPTEDRAIREMLALCRREGIEAALLFMPECRYMRRLYSPASRGQVGQYLRRLGQEFGVPVIDAQCWSADEDFADTHHLTVAGGDRFTRRLGEEVLKPWLAGRLGPGTPGAGGELAGRPRR